MAYAKRGTRVGGPQLVRSTSIQLLAIGFLILFIMTFDKTAISVHYPCEQYFSLAYQTPSPWINDCHEIL